MKQLRTKPSNSVKSVKMSLLGVFLLIGQSLAGNELYSVDPSHSYVGFSVKHLMISTVKGSFTEFEGSITMNGKSVVAAKGGVKSATINTNHKKRDEHLRAPDFFNTEKFPTISFKTTSITKKGKGYIANGEFTMRGVTKKVKIPFTFSGPVKNPWGKFVIAGDGKFTINRKDYGLTWNKALENGGILVGEKVTIELHIEAFKG